LIKLNRVGFEPTTSAQQELNHLSNSYLKNSY
jgi:hypothetical protein